MKNTPTLRDARVNTLADARIAVQKNFAGGIVGINSDSTIICADAITDSGRGTALAAAFALAAALTPGGNALSETNYAYVSTPGGIYNMPSDWAPSSDYVRIVESDGRDTVTITGGKVNAGETYAMFTRNSPLIWTRKPEPRPTIVVPRKRYGWTQLESFDTEGRWVSTNATVSLNTGKGDYCISAASTPASVRLTANTGADGRATMSYTPGAALDFIGASGNRQHGQIRFRLNKGTPGGADDYANIDNIYMLIYNGGSKYAQYNLYGPNATQTAPELKRFDEWITFPILGTNYAGIGSGWAYADLANVTKITLITIAKDSGGNLLAGKTFTVDFDFFGTYSTPVSKPFLAITTDGGYQSYLSLHAYAAAKGIPLTHYVNDHFWLDDQYGGVVNLSLSQIKMLQDAGDLIGMYLYSPLDDVGAGLYSQTPQQRIDKLLRQQHRMMDEGLMGYRHVASNRTQWASGCNEALFWPYCDSVRHSGNTGNSGYTTGTSGTWSPKEQPGTLWLASSDRPDATHYQSNTTPTATQALDNAVTEQGGCIILCHGAGEAGQWGIAGSTADSDGSVAAWKAFMDYAAGLRDAGTIDIITVAEIPAYIKPS